MYKMKIYDIEENDNLTRLLQTEYNDEKYEYEIDFPNVEFVVTAVRQTFKNPSVTIEYYDCDSFSLWGKVIIGKDGGCDKDALYPLHDDIINALYNGEITVDDIEPILIECSFMVGFSSFDLPKFKDNG